MSPKTEKTFLVCYMGYTKMSDHPHSRPLNSTYPKYTSTHPHSPPPTYKKCPPTPYHPKYTFTHTPTHPKYTSIYPTHSHPPIKNARKPPPISSQQ